MRRGMGHVYWLKAVVGSLPRGYPQWHRDPTFPDSLSDLSQWRGRAGFAPASVLAHPQIQL